MGIGLAFDSLAGIRIAAVGMLDKEAPVGHNLAGVDVLVGAGLGMVDIPSMAIVDTEVADMVCYVVHSSLDTGMTYFAQAEHKAVEVHNVEDSHFEQGYFVPGF